jgi:hypothetical protein
MKRLTTAQFKKLADAGRIHKANGKDVAGEKLCETPLEFGITNGYSLADICHFYRHFEQLKNSKRDKPLTATQVNKAAHHLLVTHISHFAASVIDCMPDFERRSAAGKPAAAKAKKAGENEKEPELCEDCGEVLDKCVCANRDGAIDYPEEREEEDEWPH